MKRSLEERVAALERQTASEALSANYLTIDPATGLVGANFSGKLAASELDLTADATRPSPIKWVTSGGAQVAMLQSDAAGNLALQGNSLTLTTPGGTPAQFSGIIAAQGVTLPEGTGAGPTNAVEWSGAETALLYFTSNGLFMKVGTHTYLLSDTLGNSDLPRLAGGSATASIASGDTTINIPGGSNGNSGTINHNIGRTPEIALGCDPPGGANVSANVTTIGANQATIRVFYSTGANAPAGGTLVTVHWIAVG